MTFKIPHWLNKIMQTLLAGVFIGLFILFLVKQHTELQSIKAIIGQTNFWYLSVGLVLTVFYAVAQALFYQAALSTIHKKIPFKSSLSLFLKRFFIGTFLPAGFTVSQYAFSSELKRFSINRLENHLASTLYLLTGTLSYAIILVPTVIYLLVTNNLVSELGYGSLIVVAVTALLIWQAYIAFRQKGLLYAFLKRIFPDLPAFLHSWQAHSLDQKGLIASLCYAFVVDFIGVALLFFTFLALHLPPSLALAFIGYVVTILLLSISPFFEGIGLIEFSLVYMFQGFGMSAEKAVAVTILFRFYQLWVPFLAGFFVFIYKRLRTGLVYFPAFLTLMLGLLNIASAARLSLSPRLHILYAIFPRYFITFSRGFVLVSGFFLLLLSYNLLRRSKRAWQISVGLISIISLAHLIKGIDVDEAIFSLVVLLVLVMNRNVYRRQSDVPTFRRGGIVLITSFCATIIYGVIGFTFLDERHFGRQFTFPDALQHTFRLYFELGDKSLVPYTLFAQIFIASIYCTAFFTLIYAAIALFQPAVFLLHTLPEDRELARSLVKKYGHDSLDFFKLYWDKYFYITPDKSAFLAYKLVQNSMALVLGDPVGKDEAAIKKCIQTFCDMAADNGWRVAFQQTSAVYVKVYKSLGWKLLKLGEEAEVNLDEFMTELSQKKEFRYITRRLESLGYQVSFYEAPLKPALVRKLRHVSDEWLTLPSRTERVFAQGMFTELLVKNMSVVTVEDKQNRVEVFITLLPDYNTGHVGLDLLRRRKSIPNGAMEFLLIKTFEHLHQKGYHVFSLGLAPLSGIGEGDTVDIPEKTLKMAYERFNSIFSYKGLRQFKAKFHPTWTPRYLVYKNTAQLPAIILASIQASSHRKFLRALSNETPGELSSQVTQLLNATEKE